MKRFIIALTIIAFAADSLDQNLYRRTGRGFGGAGPMRPRTSHAQNSLMAPTPQSQAGQGVNEDERT